MEELKDILKKLQAPLGLDEIEFMPKTAVSNNTLALILAYKDARCDMKRLDEATGGLWQNKYERDSKGVLQCGIGIKVSSEWVWKWSNGVPSANEKEKGEYSDAFKRAGFMWGIGRELYEYPVIFADLNEHDFDKSGKLRIYPKNWEWRVVEGVLWAKDEKGNKRVRLEMPTQSE